MSLSLCFQAKWDQVGLTGNMVRAGKQNCRCQWGKEPFPEDEAMGVMPSHENKQLNMRQWRMGSEGGVEEEQTM